MKYDVIDTNTVTLELSTAEFAAISEAVSITGKAKSELGQDYTDLHGVAKGLINVSMSLIQKKLENLFQE